MIEQNTSEDTHENLILLQNIFKEQTNKIVKTLKAQHKEMLKALGSGTGSGGLISDLFSLLGGKDKGKGGNKGAGRAHAAHILPGLPDRPARAVGRWAIGLCPAADMATSPDSALGQLPLAAQGAVAADSDRRGPR